MKERTLRIAKSRAEYDWGRGNAKLFRNYDSEIEWCGDWEVNRWVDPSTGLKFFNGTELGEFEKAYNKRVLEIARSEPRTRSDELTAIDRPAKSILEDLSHSNFQFVHDFPSHVGKILVTRSSHKISFQGSRTSLGFFCVLKEPTVQIAESSIFVAFKIDDYYLLIFDKSGRCLLSFTNRSKWSRPRDDTKR